MALLRDQSYVSPAVNIFPLMRGFEILAHVLTSKFSLLKAVFSNKAKVDVG